MSTPFLEEVDFDLWHVVEGHNMFEYKSHELSQLFATTFEAHVQRL